MRRLLFFLTLSSGAALADGSAQIGDNIRLLQATRISVDVLDPAVERIAWRGVGTLELLDPEGQPAGPLEPGDRLVPPTAGTYTAHLTAAQVGPWDLRVAGAIDTSGRVHSRQWFIGAEGFGVDAAI